MPQPLSKVNSTAPVLFHPKAMSERQELASLVARAVAGWSEIEGQMGTLLVKMLGANARPALAMFSALTSAPAKIATVKAAAETVLQPASNEMFQAVLSVASRRAKQRHSLAHNVWGTAEAIPDALLLAESQDIAGYWMQAFQAGELFSRAGVAPAFDWPREKILVYRKADFEEIIAQMDELYDYFYQVSFLLQPNFPWPERIFDYLNSKTPICAELLRIRKAQQNP